ncbi:MAG: HAD family phosphatase [Pseudomonadota bacterium]
MLKSILFDLDGLLVDSEPLQFRAYQIALKSFGVSLDHQAWIEWHSVEASTTRWINDQKLDLDPEEVRNTKKAHYEKLIENELELKPGAADLVKACAEEFEIAIVSSSRRESIEVCMQKFGLLQYFPLIVSGTELPRSKPFPDSYLDALKKMDVNAQEAFALEDSTTGFSAAKAACIPCIICPDLFIPKASGAFEGAALVVDSLHQLDATALKALHMSVLEKSKKPVGVS